MKTKTYIKNKGILIILIIYLFITIKLSLINESLYNNIITPLFWLCMVVYLVWNMKKFYVPFSKNKKYFINIIIILSIHVVLFFYMGFILGFSKSPYNHEIFTMSKNIIISIIPIVGIEITRSIVVIRNKKNKAIVIFLTVILFLIEINYKTLANLFLNKWEFFKYICSNILPLICEGILYTYLTLKGSYPLVLTYRLYKEFVILLLPIFPNIDWFISGCIGILSNILIYMLFEYKFSYNLKNIKKKKAETFEKISYLVLFILLITVICLMLGVFKYKPITVLSNSMDPFFSRGDIIIFKKLTNNELDEIPINAVIVYSIEDQNIVHRVVDKVDHNDKVLYQTKGDRNNIADMKWIQTYQIEGIYLFHIKYIGFPSVWLHDYFNEKN